MKIKAKDLQPGDRRTNGDEVRSVSTRIQVGLSGYALNLDPEYEMEIERPAPTVTVEIPRAVAQNLAATHSMTPYIDKVARACQAALKSEATPPVLRVGAKVRRLPRYERHDSTGRYGIGTVTRLVGGRHAIVTGPNGHDSLWDGYAFEVVG